MDYHSMPSASYWPSNGVKVSSLPRCSNQANKSCRDTQWKRQSCRANTRSQWHRPRRHQYHYDNSAWWQRNEEVVDANKQDGQLKIERHQSQQREEPQQVEKAPELKAQGNAQTTTTEASMSSASSQMVAALSVILTIHCARSESAANSLENHSAFHMSEEPQINIRDYLTQIKKVLKCSKECLILTLIYIDRIVERNSDIVINRSTVHRLLITGITVASKYWDDNGYNNAKYATIGGLPVKDLNELELEFLSKLGWRLHVLPQDYDWYHDLVCSVPCDTA